MCMVPLEENDLRVIFKPDEISNSHTYDRI